MTKVLTRPQILLHTEGAALLFLAALLYWLNGGGWLLFLLLLLAPNLSMLGYLARATKGTSAYNAFHAYHLPAILAAYGLLGGGSLAVSLALIWFAHIGMDRLLGYGLKYRTGFKDTHLGSV